MHAFVCVCGVCVCVCLYACVCARPQSIVPDWVLGGSRQEESWELVGGTHLLLQLLRCPSQF